MQIDGQQTGDLDNLEVVDRNNNDENSYKVSEIVNDTIERCSGSLYNNNNRQYNDELHSSLWLGCDDGSLIMIDCLANGVSNREGDDCDICDHSQRNMTCRNVHTEIKLGAPIGDIKVYKDRLIFVALSNGQLAVFLRNEDGDKQKNQDWSLNEPQILTLTVNELNSTSKLCLIDDEHLWYSYGRNIFVLNITTLKLETAIMTPTNDKSIQFSMQSITIENMELVSNLNGVWISFRSGPLIQFYDIQNYKLILEMSLLEPINKVLSYGNEIIRQHKTACLRATSLLNVYNDDDECNSLIVGTSAGIIIYLTIRHNELKEYIRAEKSVWNPQVISLRHGHSGQVKFLHLVELDVEDELDRQVNAPIDQNNNNGSDVSKNSTTKRMCLISGGAGIDLYGPNNEQQVAQHLSNDEDCLNYLILWQLNG